MNKLINKQIFFALCLVLMPLIASATGLGKLNVFSALGEPLNAEIELLSVTPEELASLTASLASEEQYAAQGIDKSAIQQNIKASISKKPNGSSVVHLTSSQVVNDPFLDMLIQVVWSNGQFSREYTLLLDPPEYSVANVSSPVVETTKTVTGQTMMKQDAPSSAPQIEITSKTKTHKAATKTARAKSSDTTSSVPDEHTVTTAKGDSLSAIALRLQVQDVNLDQLLLGLYKANPDAFEGGNINRLKVGQVIHVPTAEVFQSISKDEAKAEVRAQTANWHGYATKLSDAVAHSEASDSANSNQSSGKVAAKAEDKASPVADGPRDVVKLAKTETAKTSDASSSQSEIKSSEQVTSNMQDDLAAKENTIKETDEKSAALEKQIADMKQLLAIKNKSMAEAQKAAEQAKQKAIDEPSLLDAVDPLFASLVGGVLAVLLGAWVWLRRKNSAKPAVETLMEESHDVFAQSVSDSIVGSTSFLNDFSPETGALIDTHEVDPLAEAEVFLNYGRHAQAQDILKDAIQKSPERYELHLKLLEIYAQVNNAPAFELLAVELFSQLGSNDPIWAKVSELGLTIDPDNKLYHRAKDSHSIETPDAELALSDFDNAGLMDEHIQASEVLDPIEFSVPVELASTQADTDGVKEFEDVAHIEEINLDAPDEASKPLEMDLTGIDLSFETIPQFGVEDTAPTSIPDAFNGDFSNLLKVEIKPQQNASAQQVSVSKKSNQKAAKKNKSDGAESSEVATKIELAVAYIDMADKEGALELLAEALKEGGPQQRERAQALIDSLA